MRPQVLVRRDGTITMLRSSDLGRRGPHTLPRAGVPVATVLADGAWAGRRCFIVGGGPSLQGFAWGRLQGELVVAVNVAFAYVPWAAVTYSMDNCFYRALQMGRFGPDISAAWGAFKGVRCWLEISHHGYAPPVYTVQGITHNPGVPHSLRDPFWAGGNSGYGALLLAICLQADPIYLLGYDMRPDGPAANFHTHYKRSTAMRKLMAFRHPFQESAAAIAARGVHVINLNPASGLTCFPFGNVEEVLGAIPVNAHAPATATPGDPDANGAAITGSDSGQPGPAIGADCMPEVRG